MTANVRFDYFTAARGAFIKSEREDITFRNLDELETLIKIDVNMRAKKYGDEVIGHVMEVHQFELALYRQYWFVFCFYCYCLLFHGRSLIWKTL